MNTTDRTNITNKSSAHSGFGIRDGRGREIGAVIECFECDHVDVIVAPGFCQTFYRAPAGHYFAARVWATRNGQSYGAVQPIKLFASNAERSDYIQARLDSMQKRYRA